MEGWSAEIDLEEIVRFPGVYIVGIKIAIAAQL